jgi:mevalonate kinase
MIFELKNDGYGNALVIAQNNSKTKESALLFLEDLLISCHHALENGNAVISTKDLQKILKNLQKTHTLIKSTNVSPRFALENLFLNLI